MMNLVNLTEDVRAKMLDEINADIAANKLYECPRLNTNGKAIFSSLLIQAAQSENDEWLAEALQDQDCFNHTETRRTKNGPIVARVPVNANEVLAEGEFNRYYVRALCLVALERGVSSLVVYRARESSNPRSISIQMIGTSIEPRALLDDLRINIGVDTALKLPPGPNSGLSVKLPQ